MVAFTKTIPAQPVEALRFDAPDRYQAAVSPSITTASILADFSAVKGAVSNKPLRRPSRTRPLKD